MTFLSGATRSKEILELVHNDAFGHMLVPSLGGYRYYVSFIDDFSIMTSLYFLKKKVEVFEKFQEFKVVVENHKKIKVLRIDNWGEFDGK